MRSGINQDPSHRTPLSPPWTGQPGLPDVSPTSTRSIFPGGTAGGPSGSMPCSSGVRSLCPHRWSLPTCVWELMVPPSSSSPSPLYSNLPCAPASTHRLAPSQPWLLVSQVEMKINSSEGSFNFLYSSENKCDFPTTQPCKFPAL